MSNLTIKQKIILGIIVGCMIFVIGIYGYISINKDGEEIEISDFTNNEETSKIINGEVTESENINNEISEEKLENSIEGAREWRKYN